MGYVIRTPPDNVAFSIAFGVLLLSVILHPIVRWCFHRIRADRAWRSIEKKEPVEVTKYNFFSEALGDRGRWDTARVVTFMLAAFHVSTWGLELSLDLALRTDGPVDLLNRPPPVLARVGVIGSTQNRTDWIVRKTTQSIPDSGTLDNFHGTLVDGNATTSYRIGDSFVFGNTLFASWSTESARIASGLFYDTDSGQAFVEGMSCSTSYRGGDVYLETAPGQNEKWGRVTECESGPKLINGSVDRVSPPTIFLNSSEGEQHLIVEEESSYPSFLYSVWKPSDVTSANLTELSHVFYISTTTRLAEAIVSGIANRIVSGGGCVDLLMQFSVANTTYDLHGALRVSPFGEHPSSSSVERLDQVEPIVAGVLVSTVGTVCGALLIAVTGAAFIGCICCHSRSSLDVYNRDELIRAVSLPGGQGEDATPAALKIFVRRESDKAFSIIISDDGVYRGCDGLRKRLFGRRQSAAVGSSSGRNISRSPSLPAGSRELTFDGVRPTLEGVRPALDVRARNDPPSVRPPRTPTVVELIASPVPSSARITPPHRNLAIQDLMGSSVSTAGLGSERPSPIRAATEPRMVHVSTQSMPTVVHVDVESAVLFAATE